MTTGRLVLRLARPDDLPALHALAERAVFELLADDYSAEQLTGAREFGIYEVEPSLVAAGRYYVAEVDGVVVGGSGWSTGGELSPVGGSVESSADTATMRATYVDPRWSRRGYASLLARTTEAVARTAGYTRFEALCTPASQALRLRLGYHVVDRMTLTLRADLALQGVLMRKQL